MYIKIDFSRLRRKPEYFEKLSVTQNTSSTDFISSTRQVASSAKREIFTSVSFILKPLILAFCLIS